MRTRSTVSVLVLGVALFAAAQLVAQSTKDPKPGKGKCATCHTPDAFLDDKMHDLKLERFFKPREISDQLINGDGPIKTFTLRGIKDSPPYLHDGRLLTLEDTVEFFNLVLGLKLDAKEKTGLVAYMRQL